MGVVRAGDHVWSASGAGSTRTIALHEHPGLSAPTDMGEQYPIPVTFEKPGQYGINCYQYPGPVTETDITTMLTVNE